MIKANGKNMKMFMYTTHDYMGLQPETSFATYKTQEDFEKFIHHMKTHWLSGTISGEKEVTPEMFFRARNSEYWRGYEEQLDRAAEDCTEEWVKRYNELIG